MTYMITKYNIMLSVDCSNLWLNGIGCAQY